MSDLNLARPPNSSSARKKRRTSDGQPPVRPSPSSAFPSTAQSPVTPAARRSLPSTFNSSSHSHTKPNSSSSKSKPTPTSADRRQRPRFFSPPRIPRAQSADPLEGDVFDADQDPIGMEDVEELDGDQVKEEEEAQVRQTLDEDETIDRSAAVEEEEEDADEEDAGGSDYDGGPGQDRPPPGERPATRAMDSAGKTTRARPPVTADGSPKTRIKRKKKTKRIESEEEEEGEGEGESESVSNKDLPSTSTARRVDKARLLGAVVSTRVSTVAAANLTTPRKGSGTLSNGPTRGSGGSRSANKSKTTIDGSSGRAQHEEAIRQEESSKADEQRAAAIYDLGLTDVWDDLETSLKTVLETAMTGFKTRISDRIVVALSYPDVSIEPTDPSLAAFVAPYLVYNLRPAVLSSLLKRLPTLEARRIPPPPPANSLSLATYFSDRDFEELVYAPVQGLMDRITAKLQGAALEEVLASFPAILGEGPKEEMRRIVDKGRGNVLGKVKEGVRMILEREVGR